jgi:hypothetical protein
MTRGAGQCSRARSWLRPFLFFASLCPTFVSVVPGRLRRFQACGGRVSYLAAKTLCHNETVRGLLLKSSDPGSVTGAGIGSEEREWP